MELIKFRITGTPPGSLMHNPAGMKRSPEGITVKEIPTPEDEAEAGTYRLPTSDGSLGQLCGPSVGLRASLIDGAIGRRIGKSSGKRVLASSLYIVDEWSPLWHPETKNPLYNYIVDTRRACVKSRGTIQGVLRSRPLIREWQTEITFEYEPDFVTPEVIEEAFGIAGRTVGWMDYRPRCPSGNGGPFGRYVVEQIK